MFLPSTFAVAITVPMAVASVAVVIASIVIASIVIASIVITPIVIASVVIVGDCVKVFTTEVPSLDFIDSVLPIAVFTQPDNFVPA